MTRAFTEGSDPETGVGPRQRGRWWWWLAAVAPVAVILVVIGLVGRGGTDQALPAGQVRSFVVPPGTAEALRSGDADAAVLPQRLELMVGDTLELVNEDVETHRLGPVVARAGETARVRFYDAGSYDVECTVGHDRITIEVRDP